MQGTIMFKIRFILSTLSAFALTGAAHAQSTSAQYEYHIKCSESSKGHEEWDHKRLVTMTEGKVGFERIGRNGTKAITILEIAPDGKVKFQESSENEGNKFVIAGFGQVSPQAIDLRMPLKQVRTDKTGLIDRNFRTCSVVFKSLDKSPLMAKSTGQKIVSLEGQVKETKEDVKKIKSVIGSILLPVTEDGSTWMLALPSISIQQQQFCKVVDGYFDELEGVQKSRNELRLASLLKRREADISNMLPQGAISNWVVRLIEVNLNQDGTASVFLQLPCRALLGQNSCSNADNSATHLRIPANSPTFKQLETLATGDFVVVSGNLIMEQAANAPQSTSGSVKGYFSQGSYCAKTEGGKIQDLFALQVNHLFPIK
jgi:hypothetical protein